MEWTRRMLLAGTLVVGLMLGLVGMARSIELQAAEPPWDPPSCATANATAADGSDAGSSLGSGTGRAGSWFGIAPVLDERGWLVGQRLEVGRIEDPRVRHLDLPAESFAAGPFSGLVLVGEDDGRRSRMRWLDPEADCVQDAGETQDVIRSAALWPFGQAILEHRVDRESRTDLGVWRRPLDGSAATRILAGLPDDEWYGPTFETTIVVARDGGIAVASCGAEACRVRVLGMGGDPAEIGPVGQVIGLVGPTLIAYAACPGLPCALEVIDVPTRARHRLADGAGLAALGAAGPGDLVVYETAAGGLDAVPPAGGRARRIADPGSGLLPLAPSSLVGLELPPGWLPLVADRMQPDAAAFRALDPATTSIRRPAEILQ